MVEPLSGRDRRPVDLNARGGHAGENNSKKRQAGRSLDRQTGGRSVTYREDDEVMVALDPRPARLAARPGADQVRVSRPG